jgi:hypothetical protein
MIFTPFSTIVVCVTVLLVATIVYAGFKKDEELGFNVFFSFLAVILIFWVGCFNVATTENVTKSIEVSIIATDNSIICVSDGKPVTTFTDVQTYKQLNSTNRTTLIQSGWVNYYNTTNWTDKFVIKN